MASADDTMPLGVGRRPMATVVEAFREAVANTPERTALTCGNVSLSYAEYGRAVDALAVRLDGLDVRGRRVALAMPNSPRMAVAAFAAWAAGAQIAFLNPGYPPSELRPLLTSAAPAVVLVDAEAETPSPTTTAVDSGIPVFPVGARELSPVPAPPPGNRGGDPEAGDLATLMFTGGTTGVPKGVEHSHRNLLLTVQGMEACWPTEIGRETWLNVAPMFHIWGLLMGLLNPVYGRARLVMVPRFEPAAVVSAMEHHRVTVFSGGPAAIYGGLLAAPGFAEADLSSLRVCPGGGSSFLAELQTRWKAATGVPIYEAFGMTELAPIVCNPWGRPPRIGSVGLAAPTVEVQVVSPDGEPRPLPPDEAGEIRVRAPHMLLRYRGLDGETVSGREDGWLHTGDIGRLDDEGYLYIVDRKKDMIIVAGFNVYPREIDEVLMAHPDVVESSTVGVPDERKGERPVTFVVPAPGAGVDAAELRRYCAERLVDYKRPADVMPLASLPRTPANKVDRGELRRRWAHLVVDAETPGPV